MKKFLEKDSSGNWNTVPQVPAEKIRNVNCHKFALYILGKISYEEMISDPNEQKKLGLDFTFGEAVRKISDAPFDFVDSMSSLLNLTDRSCEIGKIYVGQILDAKTGEMAHSFLIERKSENEYVCFDKPGFKYPFEVNDLEKILNFINKDGEKSNQNQEWRFVPITRS